MENNIEPLLLKYLAGSADNDERIQVEDWLAAEPRHLEHFMELERSWNRSSLNNYMAPADPGAAYRQMEKRLFLPPVRSLTRYWRAAAAVAVLLGGGWLASRLLPALKPAHPPVVATEIRVPAGEKKQVVLPDSTRIWLNAGSHLVIAAGYGEQHRRLQLDGEALFDIRSHNNAFPLEIEAGRYFIEDIGTVFNLRSYSADKTFEATVLEGQINIRPRAAKNTEQVIALRKNETFRAGPALAKKPGTPDSSSAGATEQIRKTTLPPEAQQIPWRNDQLVFDSLLFEDIARQLERHYNIHIAVEDSVLKTYRFTGRFSARKDYRSILQIIGELTPMTYTIQNDTIHIQSKPIP